ncbi:hypothetical protein Hanom_Chr04g00351171 [Helianthus anomalus]
MSSGGVIEERFGISCDLSSTPTLPITFCGIQVKGEYGWRRFVLDGRRAFTDYSTVIPFGRVEVGFSRIWESRGLMAVE